METEFPDLVVEPKSGLRGRDAPKFQAIATTSATLVDDAGAPSIMHWLYGLDDKGRVHYWDNERGWCPISPIS